MTDELVVRGDAERFCLGQDPTCTGINPCRACWEMVRNQVMSAAGRAANATATAGQVQAFFREHFAGWSRILASAYKDRPALFLKIIQMRESALAKEWDDAQKSGRTPPLTPFANVALQVVQSVQAQGTAPEPVPQVVAASVPMPMPSASTMVQTPEDNGIPPDDFEDVLPLKRGDVKRIAETGSRKKSTSHFEASSLPDMPDFPSDKKKSNGRIEASIPEMPPLESEDLDQP
jgi:hypothetical protein